MQQAGEIEIGRFGLGIDSQRSVESLVERGSFNFASPHIKDDHFPTVVNGNGVTATTVVLLRPKIGLGREQAIEFLESRSLRPLNIRELLCLGFSHKELQLFNDVFGFGSECSCKGVCGGIPYLTSHKGRRYLLLFEPGEVMPARSTLAAVHKA